jgi:hypothetical protein
LSTSTPSLSIPIPDLTDPPNGPAQFAAFANALEFQVPKPQSAAGNLTTSSTTLVDVTGGAVTLTSPQPYFEIAVQALISPSASGDAKLNLSIDGTDFGQIAQVNAGGAANTVRWMLPGSTTGNAVAGGVLVSSVTSGAPRIIKLRALTTAGTASFAAVLYVRAIRGA